MRIKTAYCLLLIILLSSCSSLGLGNSLYSDLKSFEATTTNGELVTGSTWKDYIGESSVGEFVAFRTPSKGPYQGLVLIATSLDEITKAILVGGKPMNPDDGNVLKTLETYTPLIEIVDSDPRLVYSSIFSSSNEKNGIEVGSQVLKVNTYNFGNFLPLFAEGLLPSGYLSFIDSNLLIVGGRGPVLLVDNEDQELIEIKSNLEQILTSQNYVSTSGGSDISGRMGVRDTFYDLDKKTLYVSLITKNTNDCFGIGILKADTSELLNKESLMFNLYYKTTSCAANTNFMQSGGKIQKFSDGLLFTVGDFDQKDTELLLDLSNDFGKILYIEEGTKSYNFSNGHRNPQGLLVLDDFVIETEHGPKGGDEINIIYKDYFYGWPIYSYGIEYSGADVYKKPHGEEAKEPLHYFTPSIAIAEIRKYTGEEIPSWNSKYIVASLKDESLYLFEIQEQEEKVLSLTRIPMGKRIRDVAIDNEGIIWLITDDAMLVKVSNGK